MEFIISTSQEPTPEMEETARELAVKFKKVYVPRQNFSLDQLKEIMNVSNILLVTRKKLVLLMKDQEFFFHPGLALLRIQNLRQGGTDHLITAMKLQPNDTVLDCTLGLAIDAIVTSFWLGQDGRVVGIESSSLIAELTKRGLQSYAEATGDHLFKKILSNIEVCHANYTEYLKTLPAKSFDVVYFDPMFRHPIKASSGIAPLRELANSEAVTHRALEMAKRVARKRVVMKEARASGELKRLGFNKFTGGKYSRIIYGFIDLT